MAQYIGNLLHRRSCLQQPARDTVPENVNPGPGPSASPVRRPNRSLNGALADRCIEWRHVANEDGPIRGWWPLVMQIGGDRGSGLSGQRKHVHTTGLCPSNSDRTGDPIDIVKA